jgi:hypothetical protein
LDERVVSAVADGASDPVAVVAVVAGTVVRGVDVARSDAVGVAMVRPGREPRFFTDVRTTRSPRVELENSGPFAAWYVECENIARETLGVGVARVERGGEVVIAGSATSVAPPTLTSSAIGKLTLARTLDPPTSLAACPLRRSKASGAKDTASARRSPPRRCDTLSRAR